MGLRKGQTPENFDSIKDKAWKKGQSGNPKGRPKNRIPNLLVECVGKKRAGLIEELNSLEVDAIEKVILSAGNKELADIIKRDETPMYMKTLALAALHDAKNGRTKTMDLLRDRQFGAVKKQVDVTSNGESVTQQGLTPSEAKDLLKRIEESC